MFLLKNSFIGFADCFLLLMSSLCKSTTDVAASLPEKKACVLLQRLSCTSYFPECCWKQDDVKCAADQKWKSLFLQLFNVFLQFYLWCVSDAPKHACVSLAASIKASSSVILLHYINQSNSLTPNIYPVHSPFHVHVWKGQFHRFYFHILFWAELKQGEKREKKITGIWKREKR